MTIGCIETSNLKVNLLQESVMEHELYRAIMSALPFHTFAQSPVSYYSYLSSNYRADPLKKVECLIECVVRGKVLVVRACEATIEKTWSVAVRKLREEIVSWREHKAIKRIPSKMLRIQESAA